MYATLAWGGLQSAPQVLFVLAVTAVSFPVLGTYWDVHELQKKTGEMEKDLKLILSRFEPPGDGK